MKTHGPLRLEGFVEPGFQENGYLLWTDGGPDAWIVDPGFPPQPQKIIAAVRQHELRPTAVLVTHCHLDHIAGVAAVKAAYPDAAVVAPHAEQHMLADPVANLSAMCGQHVVAPPAERTLRPGDTLTLGPLTWQALDVSGHTVGGLAYYCEAAGVVLTGDTLLAGGVGRTDFPGGSATQLLGNIERHLLTLPEKTAVYSGHGPPTTIARERSTNPFLQGGMLECRDD